MKKIIIFLVLIIGWLTLSAESPILNKENKEKEHVVLRGKLIFKQKDLTPIRFLLEDKLNGYYRLTFFEENITKDSTFLKEKGIIINNILKKRIYKKSSYSIGNKKDVNYLLIDFSNIELRDKKRLKIIFLGIKVIYELEKKMGCSIYARLE